MRFDGDWACVIRTPLGVQSVTLRIRQDGASVEGEAHGAEVVPFIAPEIRGDRLAWTQKVTKPMGLTIAFEVRCDGDILSGTAKPGVLPRVKVEGTRIGTGTAALSRPGASGIEGDHGQEGGSAAGHPGGSRGRWPAMSVDTSAWGERPRVGMFVFPGMTALDLIGPHTVLGGPTWVRLIGMTGDAVTTDTGIVMHPDVSIGDAPADLDVLFVPGGPGQTAVMQDEAALAFLADRGSRARYVTSVCTGSLILGAAGLLRGYRATSHWAAMDLLGTFGAEAVGERVVIDRNRITGGGVTAGIDFGLVLLSRLFDDRVARTTELLMEYTPMPPFGTGTPGQAGEDITAEALDIMAPAARDVMQVISKRFS